MKKSLLFIGLCAVLLGSCVGQRAVSIDSLLDELVDRQAITYMPQYTLRQASSYDRATTQPGDTTWFANWDRSMFDHSVRIDDRRVEYTMMQVQGPGAIVRFWMTFAGVDCGLGELKVYIDGDSIPAIRGTAFELLSGGALVGEPLGSSVSKQSKYEQRGHNLYFPIPYAKSCKVTYTSQHIKDQGAKTGGENVYYNICYRTYELGTPVVSYSDQQLRAAQPKIDSINRILSSMDRGLDGLALTRHELPTTIGAGQSVRLDIEQPKAAIRHLSFTMPVGDRVAIERKLVLEILFDDQPSVWVPLGDFFGTGYQLHRVENWYTSVDSTGAMNSYWVMPFQKKCSVVLHNLGQQNISLQKAFVQTAPYDWTRNSMYFGAGWKQHTHLETGMFKNNEGGGGAFDLNYATLTGQGVYVGDGVALFNTVYAWWGEGDEKIFVDNEPFPSSIGTGTEDYYGYAWCRPESFVGHPYISQPCGQGNFEPGYTYNLRYRGLDAIPFQQQIQVNMEMWHWVKAKINFAPIALWYMKPGGTSNLEPDLQGIEAPLVHRRQELIDPRIKQGTIEGEHLNLVSVDGGTYRFRDSHKYGWSNDMEMVWYKANRGNRLTLEFVCDQSANKRMVLHATQSTQGGTFALVLNGTTLGTVCLNGSKTETIAFSFPNVALVRGENTLVVVAKEHTSETKNNYFTIDKLSFE